MLAFYAELAGKIEALALQNSKALADRVCVKVRKYVCTSNYCT
jgi:hypothetical protein